MSTASTAAEPAQSSRASLIDRTLSRLRVIAGGARLPFVGADDPDLPEDELGKLRAQMADCLEARGGEVLARAQAANIAQIYLGLSGEGRRRFFDIMARAFGTSTDQVNRAIGDFQHAVEDADRLAAESRLRKALRAPRVQLLTQFNALPNGIKFLVDMRADLLRQLDGDVWRKALDEDFHRLLSSWFDVGFLRLERITWDSPAALLEKLIAYEAVHEIRSWDDLRHRLHGNRRVYAYFHAAMPGEPLIFVQVALVAGMARSVQRLLDPDEPDPDASEADTAIFYSISNAQAGLRGISFGNFLIKRVVDQLARDRPNLRTFATLSPLPGFQAWLQPRLADGTEALLDEERRDALAEAADHARLPTTPAQLLASAAWAEHGPVREILKPALARAAARYLLARRPDGRPIDSVARFHLGNGARIERINPGADTSPGGFAKSYGVMVNYLYDRAEIEKNHEAYAQDRVVTLSGELAELLKGTNLLKDTPTKVRSRSTFGRMIGRA
jgi:malonyl-CoA decarboxylase